MKIIFLVFLSLILISCGGKPKDGDLINGENPKKESTDTVYPSNLKEDKFKKLGAVIANFEADSIPFYAYVKKVDKKQGVTTIGFEKITIPDIIIPKTYGADLSFIRDTIFNQDLLLATTQLKDSIFRKYYLFVFKSDKWLPVVNGFSLHVSHLNDTLIPIKVDPQNPNNMFRYYSVFDLDETSDLGYTWRLLSESVPILNK